MEQSVWRLSESGPGKLRTRQGYRRYERDAPSPVLEQPQPIVTSGMFHGYAPGVHLLCQPHSTAAENSGWLMLCPGQVDDPQGEQREGHKRERARAQAIEGKGRQAAHFEVARQEADAHISHHRRYN